jgi:flagellar assembly protein FliH
LYSADEAAKMSSSKVIKAGGDEVQIGGFIFQSILSGGLSLPARSTEKTEDFTPMELFDPSELGDKRKYIVQPQVVDIAEAAPPPPPGTFITDEDLQRYQEESYQRGLQDGKNLAERGLLNVFKGLRTAAEDLQLLREKILRDSEDDLLSLSLAIARKVVTREVAQDRLVVMRLIRTALQNLNEKDELLIRIHPDDYALLTTSQNEALKSELAAVKFTLKPDPTVEVGSCQVETERGTVDAGFEAQLDEIYRRLLEERTDSITAAELAE